MNILRFLRNSAGMGLVEVMMAIAVTGGLTLTIAKLMDNAGQGAKQVEAKTENTNLKGIVQDILNNPQACKNTFNLVMTPTNVAALTAGTPTATVTVPSIRDKTTAPGVLKYSTASTNINPLTITSMEITNYNPTAFTGDLIINSTFNKSSSIIQMVKPIRIPINFSFIAGAFSSCSTMAIGGEWMMNGNAGTSDAADYIGTSDNTPFNIRVNAQASGRITSIGETYFGYQAGLANGNGTMSTINTGFGFEALKAATGPQNVAVGYRAALGMTNGSANVAIGSQSFRTTTSGANNVAIGFQAMANFVTPNSNTCVGASCMSVAGTTASDNTCVGSNCLNNLSSGTQNVALGSLAANAITSGSSNVAVGYSALPANTTGSNNTAIGYWALLQNSTGYDNLAIGARAMEYLTTGYSNIAIGTRALQGNNGSKLTGRWNIGIGEGSGTPLTTGEFNTMFGMSTGQSLSTGDNNIFLGTYAGTTVSTGDNNIAIGHGSSTFFAAGTSNKLYIDTSGTAAPLIEGDFSFTSAGRFVKIGGALHINGQNNVDLKLTTGHAIRTQTAAASDKVYFDTRTLFRDGASGGTGFVGIAGGLGIGSGSWWDGSVIPGQGNVMIEGNVGIGTQSPSQKLHVVGNILASGTITPSDRRLKENIKPLKDSVKKLSQINGVSFQKIDRKQLDEKEIGVIAQDVKAVYPELVSTFTHTDGKQYNAVNYVGLIAPIIESFKELYVKVLTLITSDEKQNLEIKNLKAENEKLKLQMKQQQDSFEVRMKKLEAKNSK